MTTLDSPASRALDAPPLRLGNALAHYYGEISALLRETGAHTTVSGFTPGWELPSLTPQLTKFFAPSEISAHDVGDYRGLHLKLLHLMHNERTRTTKTFASLLIVARAVAHIQRTGEPVLLITPSSANKATALRDAVLRAYESGLAAPAQLGIVCLVPYSARTKLWRSALTDDPDLRARNPLAVLTHHRPDTVKELALAVARSETEEVFRRYGVRLWHTLDLANYAVADTARALFERDHLPREARVHAHSVSSAFGLLGHFYGQQHHTGREWPDTQARYFLVQHLGTSDMVSSYYHSRFDYRPAWREENGLVVQDHDPRFPARAYTPDEQLDSTFYTRSPATSERMNQILRQQDGGGIVVSLPECLDRYPLVRSLVRTAGVLLPADPRELREWSLVMAFTGVLNATDRGLLDPGEVLVHGSGSYQSEDFTPPEAHHLTTVTDCARLTEAVHAAAASL
ncbi:DUF6002 family protein [Kitasatospora sp. NPDC101157]|uniref:DUF6002 family protein n=1 Tax=Kitasatospora sp. NPDC101157 TaxID=3364098 RepID=UPI0037F5D4D2